MGRRRVLYDDLWEAWKKAYPEQAKTSCKKLWEEFSSYWNKVKEDILVEEDLIEELEKQMKLLKQLAPVDTARKITSFFKNYSGPSSASSLMVTSKDSIDSAKNCSNNQNLENSETLSVDSNVHTERENNNNDDLEVNVNKKTIE